MRSNNYFSTPPVVMNLLIINVLFFLATEYLPVAKSNMLYDLFGLWHWGNPMFRPWQFVTYMFLHGGFLHLFSNMFALWMFGRTLEYNLGSKRFLIFYLICGVGAGLIQMLVTGVFSPNTVGASGAVFGILLGFGIMHPNVVIILLIPPIPIKAKYFVILYGIFELYAGVSGKMDNIAHFAHVGGMLWGYILLRYWKKRGKIYYPGRF